METQDYILSSLNDTIMVYNINDGSYTQISASIESITGYKVEKFKENRDLYKSLIYSEDIQRVEKHFSNENPYRDQQIAYRIINAKSKVIWVSEKRIFFTDPLKQSLMLCIIKENQNPSVELQTDNDRMWFLNSLIDAQETFVFRQENAIYTYVNDAYLRLFGYQKEDLLGESIYSKVYPDDILMVKKDYKKCLENKGMVINHSHRKLDIDGNIHWVNIKCVAVANKEGEIEVQGSGFDITEIIKARQSVSDTLEKVNFYLDSITDAFFIVDNNWKIIRINSEFEKQFDRERDKIIGHTIWEVIPGLTGTAFESGFKKAIENHQAIEFSTYAPRTQVWFRAAAYPSKEGLTVLLRNFTLEKLAQENAVWITNNLEGIINNTQDLIWSINSQKIYVFVNDAYKVWLKNNFEITHVEGSKLYEQLYDSQNEIEQWEHYYDKVLSGQRFAIRYESKNKQTNEVVIFEVSFNPIFNESNEVTGAGCFAHDVTESLKAARAIQEHNERLRNIASLSSHELRRPVASILGWLIL